MFNKIRKRLKWTFSVRTEVKRFLEYMRIGETDDIQEEPESQQDLEDEKRLTERLKDLLKGKPDEQQESFQEEYDLEYKKISFSELRKEKGVRKLEKSAEKIVPIGQVYDYTGYKVLPLFRLEQMLENKGNKFSDTLFEYIDQSGMKDSEVYKKADVDRKHFSKIRTNKDYTPKKATILSFAIALELSLSETERLLESAGYSLSNSYELDIAIRFFLQKRYYDRHRINELLYKYGIETL